jgi:hypothetical protein
MATLLVTADQLASRPVQYWLVAVVPSRRLQVLPWMAAVALLALQSVRVIQAMALM